MQLNPYLTPKIVRARGGHCLQLSGETRHELLNGGDTGGALSLARSEFQWGAGPPMHAHTREDEWFWVERGEFRFQIGAFSRTLRTGDFVFGPRDVPHGYSCQSETGTLLIGVVGAGLENFFHEISAQRQSSGGAKLTRMREIAGRHGVRFDQFDLQRATSFPPFVPSGEGECLQAFGARVRVFLSSSESGGRLSVVETEIPSFMGPPPHVHEREDQVFYIRSGRHEFQLGDARVQAEAGDVVFAPRCVPHTFRVVSAEPGRALIFATPGGSDLFFKKCARLFDGGNATPENVAHIARFHDIDFLPSEV